MGWNYLSIEVTLSSVDKIIQDLRPILLTERIETDFMCRVIIHPCPNLIHLLFNCTTVERHYSPLFHEDMIFCPCTNLDNNGIIMGTMASQITSLTIVYSTVNSGADQRKHQSSASLAFVWGIHRWPVNSPHKWPVTRIMFPFDDVIMTHLCQ